MRLREEPGDVGPELAAELLAQGRTVTLRARGSSMAPLIRDGDVLTISPLGRPPRPGEVVAALSAGRLLVHRVLRARGSTAELRGDALWEPDGCFAIHRAPRDSGSRAAPVAGVIGRATAIRRGGRPLCDARLGGLSARAWMVVLPLSRLWRGARRRVLAWMPSRTG